LLVLGAGEGSASGSAQVRALQRRLADLEFAPGPIDGRYGPRTEQAVRRFQAAHGLQVDGIAGPQTLATLVLALYPGQGNGPGGSRPVQVLQRRLADLGFAPGPIDGRYGPRTEQAVRRFQAAHGLQVDGIPNPNTLARLGAQTGSRQQSSRRSRPLPVSPARTRKPAGSPVRKAGVGQTSRSPGGSSLAWLLLAAAPLAAALGLGLVVIVARGVSARVRSRQPQTGTREHAAVANGPRQPDPAAQERHWVATQDAPTREPASEHAGFQLGTEQSDADGAFNLGVLLEGQGDIAGALDAYQHADESGHGPAACNLGVLLEEQGDIAVAEAAYRRAAQHGDANGAFNLGVLLEGQGDIAGALDAYQRADECGHGPAACNLGVLLEEQGDIAVAEAAYRRAVQHGDANGAFNLGALLEEHGDQAGAAAAYDRARQNDSTPVAQMARAALGRCSPRQLTAASNRGDDHRA
jgi:peptidoglycan hydrolase-like protein with peptidoglycan-binding domain/tetratricopeptide (TPR) repeat protein